MSPRRTALSAQHLGSGRYRLMVQEPVTGPAAPLTMPRDISVEPYGDAPPIRIESVAAPTPAAPRGWSIVISVGDGGSGPVPARYRLSAADQPGWSAEIVLGSGLWEEPSPIPSGTALRPVNPNIDYTARDFDALRTLILTTVTRRVGTTIAPITVDEVVALIEEMAYLGDALSYYEDAIATEAYLSTTRRRISVYRHAALLNYYIGQGCSARTWIRVQPVDDGTESFVLPAGTKLLTALAAADSRVDSRHLPQALSAQPLVFETVAPVTVAPAGQTLLELDPATHPGKRLQAGATSATVLAPPAKVEPGELVLLASTSDSASLLNAANVAGTVMRVQDVISADADGGRVTLTWSPDDAPDAQGMPAGDGDMYLLRGNLVIADHGSTQPWRKLPAPTAGLTYWPLLPATGTTFALQSAADAAGPAAGVLPPAAGVGYPSAAAQLAAADSQPPLPAVRVCEIGPELREWTVRPSLLDSGPLALDFVVETEQDGTARLRFGDNTNGMRPGVGAELRVCQRVGGGAAGNVAAGSLRHVCTDNPQVAGIVQPVDASGGADPEPLESARQHAPEQFRVNQRAILMSDYEQLAVSLSAGQVVDAAAELASDGAAPVVTVHIYPGSWPGADAGLLDDVSGALRQCQPLGVDLRVLGAIPCPVTIELEVTLHPGTAVGLAGQQIDSAIQASLLAPGTFAFGTSLYRSAVVALVAAVPGVADVTCLRFAFTGEERRRREVLTPARGQILRLDNDPRIPANGQISYRLRGVR